MGTKWYLRSEKKKIKSSYQQESLPAAKLVSTGLFTVSLLWPSIPSQYSRVH